MVFPGGSAVKNPTAIQKTRVHPLGREDPLGKEMATHSGILAWRISWTESGRLQSIVSQRVRYDSATNHHQPCLCVCMCVYIFFSPETNTAL